MHGLITCLAIIVVLAAARTHAVSTEQTLASDPDDRPLALRIWYPNDATYPEQVKGDQLPLIIISHGAGGGFDDHEDTARALAAAGFVVAAPAHTGDNFKDHDYVRQGRHLLGRPRHIVRTIDYMLTTWRGHRQIDPRRIGLFGFSSGGFTALVVAGGQPDFSRIARHCQQQPSAWDCEYLRRNGATAQSVQSPPEPGWRGDTRVKAVVVAAPAVSYSFEPAGLARVNIPVQLWGADHDEIIEQGAEIIRRLLPIPPEYHQVANAGHFAFLAPCGWSKRGAIAVMQLFGVERICSDSQEFDRRAFHDLFNAEVVRFMSTQIGPSG